MTAVEALLNATIGLFVSWAATYWMLPLWGLTPSHSDAAGITGLFFGLSFLRSYLIRRAFRAISGT